MTALTAHTISERGGLPERITVLHKPLRFEDLRHRLLQLIHNRPGLAAAS